MSVQTNQIKTYTIREAAQLSGLRESTLRYYEGIGVIHPIQRDSSSKHRTYTDQDLNVLVAIACLSATGMSIEDMRKYLANRDLGRAAATEQVALLMSHERNLAEESRMLRLRQRYIDTKIRYWQAIDSGDVSRAQEISIQAQAIASELKKSV